MPPKLHKDKTNPGSRSTSSNTNMYSVLSDGHDQKNRQKDYRTNNSSYTISNSFGHSTQNYAE